MAENVDMSRFDLREERPHFLELRVVSPMTRCKWCFVNFTAASQSSPKCGAAGEPPSLLKCHLMLSSYGVGDATAVGRGRMKEFLQCPVGPDEVSAAIRIHFLAKSMTGNEATKCHKEGLR